MLGSPTLLILCFEDFPPYLQIALTEKISPCDTLPHLNKLCPHSLFDQLHCITIYISMLVPLFFQVSLLM